MSMMTRPVHRRGYGADDLIDAVADTLLVSAGLKRAADAHPLTDEMLSRELLDLAASFGDRDGQPVYERSAALANVSGHFADAISKAAQLAAAPVLTQTLADVRAVTRPVVTRDLKPTPQPVLTTKAMPGKREGEQYEAVILGGSADTVSCSLTTRIIAVTEALLLGEDMSLIAGGIAAAVEAEGRRIQQALVALIETNAPLADGRDLFNTTDGNLVTPAAFTVAALDTAADALRSVPDAGGTPLNQPPAVLLVPSDLEMSAYNLVSGLSHANYAPLRVVASPYLAAGAAYLFANPDAGPAVALATWAGMGGELTSFDRATAPDFKTWSMDGIALRFNSCWGVNAIGRGAVKFTTA